MPIAFRYTPECDGVAVWRAAHATVSALRTGGGKARNGAAGVNQENPVLALIRGEVVRPEMLPSRLVLRTT